MKFAWIILVRYASCRSSSEGTHEIEEEGPALLQLKADGEADADPLPPVVTDAVDEQYGEGLEGKTYYEVDRLFDAQREFKESGVVGSAEIEDDEFDDLTDEEMVTWRENFHRLCKSTDCFGSDEVVEEVYAKSKPAMPTKLLEKLKKNAVGYEVGENAMFSGMSQYEVEHEYLGINIAADPPRLYSSYRFRVTRTPGGHWSDKMMFALSELEVDAGGPTPSGWSNKGGKNPQGYGPAAAGNGETSGRASTFIDSSAGQGMRSKPAPLGFSFDEPVCLRYFRFATATGKIDDELGSQLDWWNCENGICGDPIQWVLEGGTEDGTWVPIMTQDEDYPTPLARSEFTEWFPVLDCAGVEEEIAAEREASLLALTFTNLPREHDPRKKWPECKEMFDYVRMQDACGSCWAFSAISAFNDRACIATGGKFQKKLSTQHAASCSGRAEGCAGGMPSMVFKDLLQSGEGVVTGSIFTDADHDKVVDLDGGTCWPYQIGAGNLRTHWGSKGVKCNHVCSRTKVSSNGDATAHDDCQPKCLDPAYPLSFEQDRVKAIPNSYMVVKNDGSTANINLIKQALYEKGPMTFCYHTTQAFNAYKSGVFECDYYGRVNHGMTLMGWGVENGVDYWLMKNSWSANWGDNGFAKIKMNGKCQIHYVDASDAPNDLVPARAQDFSADAVVGEVMLAFPKKPGACVRQAGPGEFFEATDFLSECARFRPYEGGLLVVGPQGEARGCALPGNDQAPGRVSEGRPGVWRTADCARNSVTVVDQKYCSGDVCFDVHQYFLSLPALNS
jgi:hypothetical protein